MEAAFSRILVICTRQLGDVLLTTPLIREAKRLWPEAAIDVLGFSGTLGLLRGNPDVRELIEVPAGSTWRQSLPLVKRLWRRYELALVAQYTDRAHLYGWVAAPVRAGQVPEGQQSWWKRMLLRHSVELGAGHSHVVLEKLRLLSPWMDVAAQGAIGVRPPPGASLPEDVAARLTPGYVVLQVPALVAYKQWPLAHYTRLVRQLAQRGRL
ncbi:MAG TPA: glycosyltransferase family 9 protein, partial [Rhizobacter sp.]|nr:glycosyltransferase family 9 protein [Rhizobacter sp.]